MSFIDSEHTETCITDASFEALETVLKRNGYQVVRTRLQISATHGGIWSTNGKISSITIIERDGLRYCEDKETAKGYLCSPNTGVLAKLVQEAEAIKPR